MEREQIEAMVLGYVTRADYQPVKPKVIAKKLKLNDEDFAVLRRTIKRLVRHGDLRFGSSHLVLPPEAPRKKIKGGPKKSLELVSETAKPQAAAGEAPVPIPPLRIKPAKKSSSRPHNQVIGVFHRTQKGFGFVRVTPPAGENGGRVKSPDRADDIFIPASQTLDAATGDTVAVVMRKGTDSAGRTAGKIVDILERETRQFVGTYFEQNGAAYVQIDGSLFTQPIYVGDPGAKNAQPDDKVVIEMIRFPSAAHDGDGVITEVLGGQHLQGVDTLSIIREFGLPEEFAADALEEARIQAEQFEKLDDTVPEDRLDLTGTTIITIDPVDARDFDDAISLELQDNGHWRLGVHIADVSHFVRPRTALDREAYNRATSVYLPDRVLPMLPEIVSNGLASLQPGKVRYTKSVFMEFSPEGVRTHTEYHSAAIRSAKRLTYEQVDEFLADRESWRAKLDAPVHDLLCRMHTLAMMLRKRRLKHGSLVLSMREVKIDLDKQGRVSGAHVVVDTESHQVIEEFMLAANEAVAEVLFGKHIPFLRRVHDAPSPLKLRNLTEFVKELGFPVDTLYSRFDIQRLLDDVKDRPEEYALNYAVLRSMQRAVYSPAEEGHYALASDCYCHFTSPIRRYPDLTIHRLLDDLLLGRKPKHKVDDLVIIGQHCSDREHRAESAERDLTKLKMLNYLTDHIGREMDAVVTGVENFGLFAQGIELPAEGLIRTEALSDDYYTFDRTTHTLTGRRSGNRYRLGDRLHVAVSRVDPIRRELDFRLVGREEAPGRVTVLAAKRGKNAGKPRDEKENKRKKRRL